MIINRQGRIWHSFVLVLSHHCRIRNHTVYIFILFLLLLRLIPYGGDHDDRRTTNDEDDLYRYLYLLPRPYSAGTDNILRGIVQGPSTVPDETFYQLVLKKYPKGFEQTSWAAVHGSLYHYGTHTACRIRNKLRNTLIKFFLHW